LVRLNIKAVIVHIVTLVIFIVLERGQRDMQVMVEEPINRDREAAAAAEQLIPQAAVAAAEVLG
jgi:hypothetical protein